MAELVVQENNNAFQISAGSATTNYSNNADLYLGYGTAFVRACGKFDFSAVGKGVITAAVLSLRGVSNASYAGYSIVASQIVRTDHVPTEFTWNVYKSGSNWGTAGASNTTTDITTTNQVSKVYGGDGAWTDIDVLEMVKVAQSDYSNVLNVRYNGQEVTSYRYVLFRSSYYSVDTSLRPKLTITYTPAAGGRNNVMLF